MKDIIVLFTLSILLCSNAISQCPHATFQIDSVVYDKPVICDTFFKEEVDIKLLFLINFDSIAIDSIVDVLLASFTVYDKHQQIVISCYSYDCALFEYFRARFLELVSNRREEILEFRSPDKKQILFCFWIVGKECAD
jgi:hypothetical protein